MPNSFAKQVYTAFDESVEAFQDALVISKAFDTYNLNAQVAERSSNTVWRTQPYIAQSFVGLDQTSNFARNYTQLSVPTTLSYSHAVPLTLSATELRDPVQFTKLMKGAMQRLASDVNVDCMNLAATTGSLVIKRTTAATGFDDIAAMDVAFNRVGVAYNDRKAFLSSGDYNAMASNLASRTLDNSKSLDAYQKAMVGNVASFDTFKMDYAYRLTAAAGTTVTLNGANQYYVPVATVNNNGSIVPVDNRFQNITIAVGGGTVKVGDAFTIAGVNEVHHITKLDTGSLKTFRITAIVSGAGGSGVVQITPPIISGTGGTDPELQYKNVTAAPANGAAITFLNTVAAPVNPFWQGDCLQIMGGKYEPAPDSGLAIASTTTDNGVTVVMTRQGSINDLSTKYRFDVYYGLVNLQPEMSGIELFSQT
jgi:hypothetical protein